MSSALLEKLRGTTGFATFSGLTEVELNELESAIGCKLPQTHRDLLSESNGVSGSDGYDRLFGFGAKSPVCDMRVWNQKDHWKFAWGKLCDEYLCFGENTWGHQYAYKFDDLARGRAQVVYELNSLSMAADVRSESFTDFVEKLFLKPYFDWFDNEVRERFSPIAPDMHLVYSPPLGMTEENRLSDLASVVEMEARAAMIYNGDVHTQFAERVGDTPSEIEAYIDEFGRPRIRILFEEV